MKIKLLCSQCFRDDCIYNGGSNKEEVELRLGLKNIIEENEIFFFCPEVYGGLPISRTPARISGETDYADGNDVLDGKARVITDDGEDVTREYLKGAKKALRICKKNNIKKAILKRSSPSCGYLRTQGGVVSREKIDGNGVTAALLLRNGIEVVSEKDFD